MSPEMIDFTFAERVPEGCAMMVVGAVSGVSPVCDCGYGCGCGCVCKK